MVNNAGYGEYGAVETVPIERVRRQLETNAVGAMRLAQLVLPAMRARESGRIVTIGSMGGRFTFPGGGWYHASKHALEALSDALRFEVAPFGVQVVLVEPGVIKTDFYGIATDTLDDATADDSPYAGLQAAVDGKLRFASKGVVGMLGGGPEAVAKVVERAVTRRRPRTRYRVTASARTFIAMRRLTTDRMWDAMMRSQFRVSRVSATPPG